MNVWEPLQSMLEYLHVAIPIIGLAVNVSIQVLGFRSWEQLTLLKSIIAGFIGGALGVIGLELILFWAGSLSVKNVIALLLTNLIIYAALGYCYFHFINLGETARRIRILRELYDSQEGLTLQEILERYNARQIVDMRMQRLLHNGQIIEKDGKYVIGNPVMLCIAKSMTILKYIILGKRSEFD